MGGFITYKLTIINHIEKTKNEVTTKDLKYLCKKYNFNYRYVNKNINECKKEKRPFIEPFGYEQTFVFEMIT